MAKRSIEYLTSPEKRSLDVLGSLAIGAGLAPVALSAAVMASIDSRSINPFFEQVRIGYKNVPVTIRKFRSLHKELTNGQEVRYGPFDPRATAIGHLLRKYGLDEIPQLSNVVRGEMSIVGPRIRTAESMDDLEFAAPELFSEWQEAYDSAKPGIVSDARFLTRSRRQITSDILADVMRSDIDYVKNASLIGDIRIIGAAPLKLLTIRPEELPAVPQAI